MVCCRRRYLKRKILYVLITLLFMIMVAVTSRGMKSAKSHTGLGKYFATSSLKEVKLKEDYDDRYIVFNRVPKCGSITMTSVCYRLGSAKGFTVESPYIDGETPHKSLAEQKEFIKHLLTKDPPHLYIRHQYFIDFEKFGQKQPIYINIIRDPIARFESFYYFSRFGNNRGGGGAKLNNERVHETIDECVEKRRSECTKPYWQVIPYFCGQDPGCMTRSRWALEKAKENIDNHYMFVGTLENLEESLKILGLLLPKYFKNAHIYAKSEQSMKIRNETYTKNKKETSEKAKRFLKSETSLSLEYELYEFVQDKLFRIKYKLFNRNK